MSSTDVRNNSIMVNKSILNIVSALNSSKTIGLFYPYKNEVDVILMASN
jgi:hypothetical protein